jgi:hypothetical protein
MHARAGMVASVSLRCDVPMIYRDEFGPIAELDEGVICALRQRPRTAEQIRDDRAPGSDGCRARAGFIGVAPRGFTSNCISVRQLEFLLADEDVAVDLAVARRDEFGR